MESRVVYVLTIAAIGGLVACGGKQTPKKSGDDEVIGKPPSETDDPFEIMRTPEDAQKAASSGYIGPEKDGKGDQTGEDDENRKGADREKSARTSESGEDSPDDGAETTVSSKKAGDGKKEESSDQADTSTGASEKAAPSDESGDESPEAVRASKAEPPADQKKAHEPETDEGVQCFSCVRICPVSSGSGEAGGAADCGGNERDVICGWGVHSEKASARRLATAECNGALDMARRMKTWSRIEGKCPEPTCR
ncbi:MAG: hypothetical protein ABEN55_02940 [Bradymonadaceae bacterium]